MMTEKNKMECDDLLKTHEMTQKLLDANTADAAMLATLVQMARGGKDEMAMYMLHNLKPFLGGPRTLGADRVFVNIQVAQISRSIFVQFDD